MKIQHYEHLYQQEFNTLQSQLLNPTSSDQKCQVDIVMYFLKSYFDHHTKRLIRQIRYRESCLHVKLIRQHRHRSLSQKNKRCLSTSNHRCSESVIKSHSIRISVTYW